MSIIFEPRINTSFTEPSSISSQQPGNLAFAVFQLVLWILNLAVTLAGLLMSLFLTVSH